MNQRRKRSENISNVPANGTLFYSWSRPLQPEGREDVHVFSTNTGTIEHVEQLLQPCDGDYPDIKTAPGYFCARCVRPESRKGKGTAPAGMFWRDGDSIADQSIYGFDFDAATPESFAEVRHILEEMPHWWALYTTASHTDAEPRFRVVLATDKPANGAEQMLLVRAALLDRYFPGHAVDSATFTAAQVMYRTPQNGDVSFSAYKTPLRLAGVLRHARINNVQPPVTAKRRNTELTIADDLAGIFTPFMQHLLTLPGARADGNSVTLRASASHGRQYSGENHDTSLRFSPPGQGYTQFNVTFVHDTDRQAVAQMKRHSEKLRYACEACGADFNLLQELTANYHSARNSAHDGETGTTHNAPVSARKPHQVLDHQGMLGDYRDKARKAVSERFQIGPDMVPPDVRLKKNKDGVLTGYDAMKTRDNLHWMLSRQRYVAAYNEMSDTVELCRSNGARIERTEAAVRSRIVSDLERAGLSTSTFDEHFTACAEENRYHPVDAWLRKGGGWDGVKRVDRVLSCLNAEKPEYANAVMRSALIAAVHAIDLEKPGISFKAIPTLFSEQNNYHKTHFFKRLFSVADGVFKEALYLDPKNKDSVKTATNLWVAELGEVDSMTKKESSELKAFVDNSQDAYRAAYARTESKRARRTVFVASVNKDDFIRDASIASRFPVISLAAPIAIDEVNRLLGWTYNGSGARLTDPEQLRQFWLEVKSWVDAGEGYDLPAELTAAVQENNRAFIAVDPVSATIDDYFARCENAKMRTWMTTTDFCRKAGIADRYVSKAGKLLRKKMMDLHLPYKNVGNVFRYHVPVTIQ